MGSGKTTLAQGALQALVGRGVYRSPSFALVHAYDGRVFHADLDRIAPGEWDEVGADEVFGEDRIALLEHGERVAVRLPVDRLEIRLARGAGWHRRVAGVIARGPKARAWLRRALGQRR